MRVCPTGAIFEVMPRERFRPEQIRRPDSIVRSVCPYCGVGCQLDLHTADNKIVRVTSPDIEIDTPNQGSTCVKGRFGYDFPQHRDRLTRPLIRRGWEREFSFSSRKSPHRDRVTYDPFVERGLALESPSYFKTDQPEADRMTYGQLKGYIAQLQVSGFHVVPYMVQLQRKIAFPFVTLIMTLLAVPFAVTTGRRGALYGIGIGIALAITYWTMLSVFGALGAAGFISPMLAAWAPNIIFGAAAAYMILTVRT